MRGTPLPAPATTTLEPGETVRIQVELMMHAGMGGPHLFQLTIPVAGVNGQEQPPLELYIQACFGC